MFEKVQLFVAQRCTINMAVTKTVAIATTLFSSELLQVVNSGDPLAKGRINIPKVDIGRHIDDSMCPTAICAYISLSQPLHSKAT